MSRRWLTALVAVLVVADLVVLVVAFRAYQGSPPGGRAEPSYSLSQATGSATSTAGEDGAAGVVGPVMMTLAESGVLLRATRGACEERFDNPARVTAGPLGQGFQDVELPGLMEVLGVGAVPGRLLVTGLDRDCGEVSFESTDEGGTWKAIDQPGIWRLTPDTTSSDVVAPRGAEVSLACPPTQVVTSARGRALAGCGSNGFFLLQPGVEPVSVAVDGFDAASMVSAGGGARYYVVGATGDCGAQVGTLDVTSQEVTTLECLGGERAPLGIAADGDQVVVQVGNDVMVSTDGGQSFERRG